MSARARRSPLAAATMQPAPCILSTTPGRRRGRQNTIADWEWVLGVNLGGWWHGVRAFTPLMLELAGKDPDHRGHIVNTVGSRPAIAAALGFTTYPNTRS